MKLPTIELSDHACSCAAGVPGMPGAGRLVAACSGPTFTTPTQLQITAALSTTGTCGNSTATATTTAAIACCKNGFASPFVRGARATCFACSGSSSSGASSSPYYQGAMAGALVTGGRCGSADGTTVGAIATACSASARTMTFNVTTSRLSSSRLQFWVGCNRPDARRCSAWAAVPPPGSPVNTLDVRVGSSDANNTHTSWKWSLPRRGCTCDQLFWSVSATGSFHGAGSC